MKIKRPLILLFLLQFSSILSFSITSDCDIVKYISRCQVKDGKLIQIDTIVLQVNNRVGEKYSELSIPYSKFVKISDIEGWIIDANGKKVRSLKSSDIQDRSLETASTMYNDSYEKVFELKHNTYPYKIYYTYRLVKSQFVAIADWSPVLYKGVSTLEAKLYVTVPKNYPIKKYYRNATFVDVDSTGKDFTYYSFKSSFEKVKLDEQFAEPFENIMPKVVITPRNFFYGVKGGASSWVEFGNWFLDLNRDLLTLPESEKLIVDDLLKGVTTPKEKAKKLYYYLQDHTRYINISIGVGGFKSYPASYVCQNKYGDCKALTNYMMALLKYAGIKSYYTLINSSVQPEKVIEEMPYSQFNHIILTVPFNNDTLWLENTSTTSPFGFIGLSIQNRKALFIDENNSRLIKIPCTKNINFTESRRFEITIDNNGRGNVNANLLFKGNNYELYNHFTSYRNKNEQDETIRELMPYVNCEVLSWQFQKFNRDSAKIQLNSNLKVDKFFNEIGSDFYFGLNPIIGYSFERPSERKFALEIATPIFSLDTIIVHLPKDFSVKRVPDKLSINSQFGKFELNSKQEVGTIYIFKKLIVYPSFYGLDKYTSFYDFIMQVKEFEKRVVIINNTSQNN